MQPSLRHPLMDKEPHREDKVWSLQKQGIHSCSDGYMFIAGGGPISTSRQAQCFLKVVIREMSP